MEFVHRPYLPGQTIAAIATPPGSGGVAIIRISGNEALDVASKIFTGQVLRYASHTAHFGSVQSLSGTKIDTALLLVMRAPRSFTGEDTVEIQCHGGSLVARHVLDAVLSAGALPALPGEFTFKAYLNGKIDLAQAEAIQSLIAAKNDHALLASEQQLEGALSEKIRSFQTRLTDIAAIFEAWVDFPEEGLEFAAFGEVIEKIETVQKEIKKLIDTFHQGKMISDGVALCLVGAPNVGKSSLMNALLGKERAIVSPIPGTTRDLVEDDFHLNGLHLRLIDTAGIRHTEESIEEEGIRRSKKAITQSDLVLFVLDATQSNTQEHRELVSYLPPEKTIAVWNKIDLPHEGPLSNLGFEHVVSVSAFQKMGLDLLHQKIDQILWEKGAGVQQEVIITSLRHKNALSAAYSACSRVIEGLKNELSPEFVSSDMRQALIELGSIIGANITEDILTAVFSKFCIGK